MFIFCTLLSNKPGFINPELTLAKQSIWACFKIIDHPENWMVSDRRNGNGWSLVHTFLQVWVLAVAIIGISIDAPCQPKSRFFCAWNVTSTWGSFLGYGWLQPGLLDSRGCWDIINRILNAWIPKFFNMIWHLNAFDGYSTSNLLLYLLFMVNSPILLCKTTGIPWVNFSICW